MRTKTLFTICLLLLGATALQAQELERFYGDNGKFGYKDQNGKEIVIPKYDRAYEFSEGMARVQLNRKWGFIDKTGKEISDNPILKLKYDAATDYSEGLAAVAINLLGEMLLWRYIDKTGKEVTTTTYKEAEPFSEGLALVKTMGEFYNYIDKNENHLIPASGTGDALNFETYLTPERIVNARSFSEGVAAVKLFDFDKSKPDRWGFIDKTATLVIPAKYDDAGSFKEGLVAVNVGGETTTSALGIETTTGGKWGFIDKTGKEIISLKYDNVGLFSEGLSRVQLNNKWGFIDKTGKEVIPPEYEWAGDFKDGKARVRLNGKYIDIDKTGNKIEDESAVLQKMATAYQSGNFTEAFKLAEQLANKHNADAMNLLGNMYAQGQGTKQNYGMARSWWEMASNKGNAAATGNIGLLYAQGWGVPQNITEAEKWFKKGADLGDPQSMFNLGNLAFQKGNLTEAKQWIQKAKTAGHPQADTALQQINQAEANANRMRERE